MKAHLIFDTSDPDDKQEYIRCVKSFDMAQALWDILQLRNKLDKRFEHNNNANNDVFDGLEAFAEGIKEILEDNNINIDELTS
jgi:hypothetical protein